MNRGRHSGGYTIVETLIFLAVSGALFISAVTVISGRQGRTEFTSAARDFEAQIQDIANDVSTGYYANPALGSNFLKCSAPLNSALIIGSGNGDTQGANTGCIFIGKTLQLGVIGAHDEYRLMTLAGKQRTVSGADVSSFTESTVRAIASPPEAVDLTESKRYPAFEFVCTMYSVNLNPVATANPCSTPGFTQTDNITFMTTFVGINAATQNRDSDDTKVDLLVHQPPSVPVSSLSERPTVNVALEANRYGATLNPITPTINPAGGVYICLNSNNSQQYALLRLGGQGSRFGTNLKIESGRCQ